jgi:hypothetical protein
MDDLGEAGERARADPEVVGLVRRSDSRRTCSAVGGRNARGRDDVASKECCFATAMRHRVAVSHDRAGCKHKSSNAVATEQTAADGAKRSRQQLVAVG